MRLIVTASVVPLHVRLQLTHAVIRDWSAGDLASLVHHADNRNVWINLRDRFPHPHREEHGRDFLTRMTRMTPPMAWAIEVEGYAVGGIGLECWAKLLVCAKD